MENYVTVARMRNIVNVYNVVVGGNWREETTRNA
jgi:hypothetical protein